MKSSRGNPDFILLFTAFIILCFGVLMVFSSSSIIGIMNFGSAWYFTKKQIAYAILGLFLMLLFMNIRYTNLKRIASSLLIISVFMLILVYIIGEDINGARRWLNIGGMGIQPSELVKLCVIIHLATIIDRMGDKLRDFNKGLLPLLIVAGIPILFILFQPDFGSSLLLMTICGVLLFVGGARVRHFLAIIACFLPICVYLIISKSYRLQRITAFMNPWEDSTGNGYQLVQSLYALGHGGITGVGFGQSVQKLFYLPEAHTDFIFAIIGEEFGLIGAIAFLLIYLFLILRGIIIALQSTNRFGQLLGTGIISMLGFQLLFNIGAVTGSLPITGVALPLISYGGSSLLVSMSGIGILLSISRENHRLRKAKQDR